MLNPQLMRFLTQQAGPDFYRKSAPVDPQLMARRNFALVNQDAPPSMNNPMPSEHIRANQGGRYMADAVTQFQDRQIPQFTPQEMASAPQSAPQSGYPAGPPAAPESSWLDRLVSDPKRMGMLRYGLGALSGEGMGQAMDKGFATYQNLNMGGPPPQMMDMPIGQNEMGKFQWMGQNYQDPDNPDSPRGFKLLSKANRWSPWQSRTGRPQKSYKTVKSPYGRGGIAQQDESGKLYNYKGPEKATKEPKRRVFEGIDGHKYYEDTQERVFPNLTKPDKETAQKAGWYKLPNDTYITHNQLMSKYKQAMNIMDPWEIALLATQDPTAAADAKRKSDQAMQDNNFDDWAMRTHGVDTRGGFRPQKTMRQEAPGDFPPLITTQEEYDALPSGAEFTDESGIIKRKP